VELFKPFKPFGFSTIFLSTSTIRVFFISSIQHEYQHQAWRIFSLLAGRNNYDGGSQTRYSRSAIASKSGFQKLGTPSPAPR
jgi:hypothetical protein